MRKILLVLPAIIFSLHGFSQNQFVHVWDYTYGGAALENVILLQQTSDGGYILGGSSASGISGTKTQANWGQVDYWVVKIDSLGNLQWDKDFGGTYFEGFTSLQQTSDGGYILGGHSNSGISGNKTQPSWGGADYWIVKIDSLGNQQWDKTFGGTSGDQLFFVRQTSDGGYILGGVSASGISGTKTQASWGFQDYWIVKTDSSGNIMWDKDFGSPGADDLRSLEQTSDGGYILAGATNGGIGGNKTQPSWGSYDYWIVRVDSIGNLLWEKDIGGMAEEYLYSVHQLNDGGFIMGGTSKSGIGGNKTQPTWGNRDYWIVKIDSLGNILWDRDFGGTGDECSLRNIFLTADGGFMLAGISYSPLSGDKSENNLGMEQGWIVKTDSLGVKQWDKTILSPGHDEGIWAVESMICSQGSRSSRGTHCIPDGCFVTVIRSWDSVGTGGYRTQPSWGNTDYWVVKLCDTTFHVGVQAGIQEPIVSFFPNPATSELRIENAELRIREIEIYNTLGEVVRNYQLSTINYQLSIDVSQLLPGVYFVAVTDDRGNKITKRFIKM